MAGNDVFFKKFCVYPANRRRLPPAKATAIIRQKVVCRAKSPLPKLVIAHSKSPYTSPAKSPQMSPRRLMHFAQSKPAMPADNAVQHKATMGMVLSARAV